MSPHRTDGQTDWWRRLVVWPLVQPHNKVCWCSPDYFHFLSVVGILFFFDVWIRCLKLSCCSHYFYYLTNLTHVHCLLLFGGDALPACSNRRALRPLFLSALFSNVTWPKHCICLELRYFSCIIDLFFFWVYFICVTVCCGIVLWLTLNRGLEHCCAEFWRASANNVPALWYWPRSDAVLVVQPQDCHRQRSPDNALDLVSGSYSHFYEYC